MYILLTPSQASVVRGINEHGTMLMPRQTLLGGYALPVTVLEDPTHEHHWAYLKAMPQSPTVVWPPEADEIL